MWPNLKQKDRAVLLLGVANFRGTWRFQIVATAVHIGATDFEPITQHSLASTCRTGQVPKQTSSQLYYIRVKLKYYHYLYIV